MTFYVSNWSGKEMASGKRFVTLEAAIEAAKTTMRRSAARSTHGTVGFDVMEEIPGRHTIRAIVNLDLTVTLKNS